MRRILSGMILLALFLAPVKRVDIAKLLPIEAVAVWMEGENVVLQTDAGYATTGKTVLEALEKLIDQTPAVVYLDTAAYLMVSKDALDQTEALRDMLKPSVRVFVVENMQDIKQMIAYVSAHGGGVPLRKFDTKNFGNN